MDHLVLIPLMSPGHLIPMIDMAKLLSQHNVHVTIVTTPLNALRFTSTLQRSSSSGHPIQVLTLPFPSLEAGLPEHCENMDTLSDRALIINFFEATNMLQPHFEDLLRKLHPPPSCLVSGKNLGWTVDTCKRFRIPRIFFDGMGCFASTVINVLECSRAHEAASSLFDEFLVPGLPHRIQLCRAKLPEGLSRVTSSLSEARGKMRASELYADGVVVNTFAELEGEYLKEYKRFKGDNVWCIGPVSTCNESEPDRAERGHENLSVDARGCLKWLDKWEKGSVVYACLGSICGLNPVQLKELGLGLEESKRPFVWAIRGDKRTEDLERWISEEGFEERTGERGLVIRGWAPQLAILSHPAVGGFLSHCGWNSTIEGVSAGVPLLTCPLFAEQFVNEKLAVDVLGVGVSVGVEAAVTWGLEDESGLVISKEGVRAAVEKVFDSGKEAHQRRNRARELGALAKTALASGGSSYMDIKLFIQYVKNLKH